MARTDVSCGPEAIPQCICPVFGVRRRPAPRDDRPFFPGRFLSGFPHQALDDLDGRDAVRLGVEVRDDPVAERGDRHLPHVVDVRRMPS